MGGPGLDFETWVSPANGSSPEHPPFPANSVYPTLAKSAKDGASGLTQDLAEESVGQEFGDEEGSHSTEEHQRHANPGFAIYLWH